MLTRVDDLLRTSNNKSVGFSGKCQNSRSVAANIDYSLVSDLSYIFLQLQIGPTDLFMVVPRNDAIFPKLHTYHTITIVTSDDQAQRINETSCLRLSNT